jgi:hypothetical protein
VEGRRLLCHQDRVALGQDQDGGTQFEARHQVDEGGQGDQRLDDLPVLDATADRRRGADDQVVGPDPVVAQRLGCRGGLVDGDGRYGETVPSTALPAPCLRRPWQGRSSVADPPTELAELLPMVSEQRRIGSAAHIHVCAPQPVLGRNVAVNQILQRATTGWAEGMQGQPSDGVRPARGEESRNDRLTDLRRPFANPGQVILPYASVETTNRPARARGVRCGVGHGHRQSARQQLLGAIQAAVDAKGTGVAADDVPIKPVAVAAEQAAEIDPHVCAEVVVELQVAG